MSETAKEWYEVGYDTGYDMGYEKALVEDEQDYFMIEKCQEQKEDSHSDVGLRLNNLLSCLNADGQQKAVERVEELTEIPRYRAETAPQSPPAPQEGNDTTPPPDAPGEAQEDE